MWCNSFILLSYKLNEEAENAIEEIQDTEYSVKESWMQNRGSDKSTGTFR